MLVTKELFYFLQRILYNNSVWNLLKTTLMKNMSPKGGNIHFVIVGKSCTFLEFMLHANVGVVFLDNSCKPLKKIQYSPIDS
jgi:hypothetical protein